MREPATVETLRYATARLSRANAARNVDPVKVEILLDTVETLLDAHALGNHGAAALALAALDTAEKAEEILRTAADELRRRRIALYLELPAPAAAPVKG